MPRTKRKASVLKAAYFKAADSLAQDNKRHGQIRDACDRHLADLNREYNLKAFSYFHLSHPFWSK